MALLHAQDVASVDANLDFSRDIIQRFHFHARVELQPPKGNVVRFEYDRYPEGGSYHGAERIKADEGVFARRGGGAWLKSDDWGQTGTPASAELIPELDTYTAVANVPFKKPENHDLSQGKNVWKFIEKTGGSGITYYTYERSREHPHAGGLYPRFTFMKAAHDVDGKLFCVMATGQLRSGDDRIPFVIYLIYLVPLPAGTQVKVFDQVTKKEEYHTVTSKDSGWEITAQQSAPPTDAAPAELNVNATVQDFSPAQPSSTNAAPTPGGD
jgi:hypothetical protein